MSKPKDAYAKLASLYDLFAADEAIQACYREWREALLSAIEERKLCVRTLVDLACGTGNSTIPWTTARRTWSIVGVDGSPAMLREARRKSLRVRWVHQDLRELDLGIRADVVTCHFDALNHLVAPGDLAKAFAGVSRLLDDGGLFAFDMNTVHWLRWLDGREKLYRIGPHVMTASNSFDERSGVATFRQLWFVKNGRLYERRDVEVRERAYATTELRAMLQKAGLRLVKSTAQSEIDGTPIRMLYLAVKK